MSGLFAGIAVCIIFGFGYISSTSVIYSTLLRRSRAECAPGTYHHVANSGCKSFRRCLNGHWTKEIFSCPSGLLFNDRAHRCDWPNTFTCHDSQQHHNTHVMHTSTIATTTPPTTLLPTTTQAKLELGQWQQCGGTRCYHGTCAFVSACYHCPQNEYQCKCSDGYTGYSCSLHKVPDSECIKNHVPCHSGVCAVNLATAQLTCHCTKGYTGSSCQHRIGTAMTLSTTSTTQSTRTTTTSTFKMTTASGINTTSQTAVSSTDTSTLTRTPTSAATTITPSDSKTSRTKTSKTDVTTTTTTTTEDPITSTPVQTSSTSLAATTTTHGVTNASFVSPTVEVKPSNTTTLFSSSHGTTVPSSSTTLSAFSSTPLHTTENITTSSQNLQTTTAASMKFYPCNKLNTVMDIGNHITAENNNLTSCASGSFGTPEAFVLAHCQTPLPSDWQMGINVMQQCNKIPLYTPLATFTHNFYATSGALSGIFLGCLQSGFKLGVQVCDHVPEIIHVVNDGLFAMNPNVYYTVQ